MAPTPDRCIGVISDTHGLLRPEALTPLKGCRHIIHAGDVGGPEILPRLRALAPLTVVRGNVDQGSWSAKLPPSDQVEFEGISVYVRHILEELDLDPRAAGFGVVVYGHTHRPDISERDGVLYLNPGSAGPKRFSLPISVAYLYVEEGRPRARLITL